MKSEETVVKAEDLSKHYRIGDQNIPILDSVSLSVARGEFLVIQGNSGSGKTTLLSLLSGLDTPSKGSIWLDGRNISGLSEDELAPLRNEMIGFVFQAFHLVPSLNGLENVMFPAELRKDPKARDKAEKLLHQVGMWDRRDHMVEQLSGGEKQRLAICRALINGPRVLFADEPTGNLDSGNSREIMILLKELHREKQTTLIMATHSLEIADQADRVLRLADGRLFEGNGDQA